MADPTRNSDNWILSENDMNLFINTFNLNRVARLVIPTYGAEFVQWGGFGKLQSFRS